MRRFIITVLIAALAVVLAVSGAVVAGPGGGSSRHPGPPRALVARRRSPTSTPTRPSSLGHKDVTPASLHAQAMCDKGGAVEADIGPGSNWNCLVSWTDPNVPMPPEGYGKFELDVHSNGCYTAGGPSKLVGFQTITDTEGDEVNNPVYEFDGCFDPNGDNTPTGNEFPSLLNVTIDRAAARRRPQGLAPAHLRHRQHRLPGHRRRPAGDTDLGTVPVDLPEEQTANCTSPPRSLPARTA